MNSLSNAENKEQLLELIKRYVFDEKERRLIKKPFLITVSDKIQKFNKIVTKKRIVIMRRLIQGLCYWRFRIRLIPSSLSKTQMYWYVWAYNRYHVRHKCYFKYDAEKYANIRAICDFSEEDVCLALPTFHAITGCDTTSYV